MTNYSPSRAMLLTAAVSLSLAEGAAVQADSPYLAGDMHNHNTCTDGSVSVGYAIDRSVGSGTDALGSGSNYNLDWFTLGNHGGSGNRDCRFSDPGYNNYLTGTSGFPASEVGTATTSTGAPRATLWTDTFGQTIQGTTVNALLGTPNGNNMWRWQNIQQVEYPILTSRGPPVRQQGLDRGLGVDRSRARAHRCGDSGGPEYQGRCRQCGRNGAIRVPIRPCRQ